MAMISCDKEAGRYERIAAPLEYLSQTTGIKEYGHINFVAPVPQVPEKGQEGKY